MILNLSSTRKIFLQYSSLVYIIFVPYRFLNDEIPVLLLYSLVHGNCDFQEYVLVRTDLDTLVCFCSPLGMKVGI
jgi:hypothetical protein